MFGVVSNILNPYLNIFKAFSIGYRIYKNNGLCSLVNCTSQIAKPFLSGSVPNLHFKLESVEI